MMNDNTNHRVLIQFAHPALQNSRVNRRLISGVESMAGVTFNDLYERYPTLYIDVEREQELLTQHDIVILHHPFYWYSTPAILKEWQDLVLQHGWAYGRQGRALEGKFLFNVISTGGPRQAYTTEGRNHFTLRQLLAPLEQTATLCRMHYLAPFAVHGTHLMPAEQIELYTRDYHHLLQALVEGRVDLDRAAEVERLNDHLAQLIQDDHVR